MNTVTNIEFHKIAGVSTVAEELLASQDGLYSMELVISLRRQSIAG